MKERTLRFILDSLFFDAMSPEFKKANDILLRIVKMNDRTDGLPHTRLVEINKAFKANDPKAARAAFEIKPLLRKPINFIQRLNRLYDEAREKKYGGSVSYDLAHYIREVKDPIRASYFMLHDPKIKSELVSKLNQLGIDDTQFFISRLQSGYLAF